VRRAANRGVSAGRAAIDSGVACEVRGEPGMARCDAAECDTVDGVRSRCAVTNGAVTNGAVTNGAVTSGAVTSGAVTSGVRTGRSAVGCGRAPADAVVVAAATSASTAPAVRAASGSAVVATPACASIHVKIPDQPNMAVKAMTSKSARLIVAVTNSHAPAKRNTKTRAVEIARRRFRRWSRIGVVINRAAKPSTIMPATLSCRSLLLFKGTQPTSARFTPITVRQTNATVAAPRRPARAPSRRSSRRTRTA